MKHWVPLIFYLFFLRRVQPSLLCTLLRVHCRLPVSVYQRDGSIRSLCHHHSSFPSAASPNCKHSPTSCLRLRSLTPVSYGRWSPTDVSVPQSPPLPLSGWAAALSEGFLGWPSLTRPGSLARGCTGALLANTLPGKFNWLLVIYSAQLSAVCMSAGWSKDKMGLSRL